MELTTLKYSKEGSFLSPEKNIGVIRLDRPEVYNSINIELIDEFSALLDEVENDPEVRVVLVTADGEKFFCTGVDLKAAMDMAGDAEAGRDLTEKGQALFRKIENLSKPVIAAINGLALGGGLEMCLACDIRIASENAKLGSPEVQLGLIPAWGGTQRLGKIVGMGLAKELVITGSQISATDAEKIRLVNKVVPPDELMSTATFTAAKIAGNAPIAVSLGKNAVNRSFDVSIEEGNKIEVEAAGKLMKTDDLQEGFQAFFEKRRPSFKGK